MSTIYPFLQHILVAASALHYSNVVHCAAPGASNGSKASVDATVDALRARHSAIKGLQEVLENHRDFGNDPRRSDEKDALLATVLFFVNFALIDSGKGGWRSHMKAARALIAAQASNYALIPRGKIEGNTNLEQSVLAISGLNMQQTAVRSCSQTPPPGPSDNIGIRDYIASDSVAYYIWGTTLDTLSNSAAGVPSARVVDTEDIRSIIVRTEANSYHSCPAHLLLLILRISRLSRDVSANPLAIPNAEQMNDFVSLLQDAQGFDSASWANMICVANAHVREVDEVEIQLRTAIATAYRAAVCLYVLLSASGLQEHVENVLEQVEQEDQAFGMPVQSLLPTTEELTKTIFHQLSLIPESYPLFKYTTWPVFMTGVEAVTAEHRSWILWRLDTMWTLCPWGMMKSAKETLGEIWELRDGLSASEMVFKDSGSRHSASQANRKWLLQLKSMGSDFLIV